MHEFDMMSCLFLPISRNILRLSYELVFLKGYFVIILLTSLWSTIQSTLSALPAPHRALVCVCVSVMWVCIPAAMLYSSWALKPRHRRVVSCLIRAGVSALRLRTDHSPFFMACRKKIKHKGISDHTGELSSFSRSLQSYFESDRRHH